MKAEAGSAGTPARVLAGVLQNRGPVRGWSLGVGDDIGYALLVASLDFRRNLKTGYPGGILQQRKHVMYVPP